MTAMSVLPVASVGLLVAASLPNGVREMRSPASITRYQQYRLTHQLVPCGPVPTALDPNGVYPYVSYCETSDRPILKQHEFIALRRSDVSVARYVTPIAPRPSSHETCHPR